MLKRTILRLSLLLLFLAVAQVARADGILIPGPWPPPPDPVVEMPPAFGVKYHHVDVKIEGQIARTHIDQVFTNSYHSDLEATYLFPIPEGAAIKEFKLWMGNEPIPGEVLDKDEARRIYEEIVRRRIDPGLLEYMDRGLFKASIYPVPAHGEQRIEIEYTEVLSQNNNTVRYNYPLNTERFSSQPIETVRVSVDINSKIPIKNVYSPSHNVSTRRPDDKTATISYEETNTRPDIDFTIYYTLSEDDIGMGLLTYRPAGEDGYFLFMASPRAEVQQKQVAAKDIVFVFDRTGSMSGEKIEQAREALKFALNNLNDKDRFNVVPFNEAPDPLFTGLKSATKDNIKKALELAGSLTAEGGTNIDEALTKSLPMLDDKNRPSFIMFLTDGLPTVGVTDIDTILTDVKKAAPGNVRLFAFGVGYDVNTFLLDKMTAAHKGAPEYVRPGEDLEVKVSTLYRKISYPILSDLTVDFGGMDAYDMFPSELPDLFKGSQIIVAGRYRGKSDAKIKLTGRAEDKDHSFKLNQTLDESTPFNDFIPLLWAQRKIGFLLAEIRLHGSNQELVQEVIRLSKKHGIITEYTSFLVREPEMVFSEGFDDEAEEMFKAEAAPTMDLAVGGSAVNQSINMSAQKDKKVVSRNTQNYYAADGSEVVIDQVRNVANRTFFQQGANWVENEFTEGQEVLNIKAFSEAQFQLLEKDPTLGKLMSLGTEVLVMINGNAVQIGATGEETLTDEQLKKLFGS